MKAIENTAALIKFLVKRKALKSDQRVYGISLLAGLLSLSLVLCFHFTGLLQPLENSLTNYEFKNHRKRSNLLHDKILFITVTENTLETMKSVFGRWPWAKNEVTLAQKLIHGPNDEPNKYLPSVFAYDMPFSYPDTRIETEQNNSGTQEDLKFTKFIATHPNTCLPIILKKYGTPPPYAESLLTTYQIPKNNSGIKPRKLPGAILSMESILDAASMIGHTSYRPDQDGTVRYMEMILAHQGKWYPSLSLAITCQYYKILPNTLIIDANTIKLPGAKDTNGNPVEIPIDEKGRCLINYYGSYYQEITPQTLVRPHDIKDFPHLRKKILAQNDPLSKAVYSLLPSSIQDALKPQNAVDRMSCRESIASALTQLINSNQALYSNESYPPAVIAKIGFDLTKKITQRFKGATISAEIHKANYDFVFDIFRNEMQAIPFRYIDFVDLAALSQKDDRKNGNPIAERKDTFFKAFDEAIVLLHVDASGIINLKATPYGKAEPAMTIQANMINNILTGDYLKYLPKHLVSLSIILIGLLLVFIYCNTSIGIGVSVLTLACLSNLSFAFYQFHENSVIYASGAMLLVIVFPYIISSLTRYYSEQQEKAKVKGAFSKYVSADVVNEILKDPDILTRPGIEKELTIFFSDLSGFTTISEKYKEQPTMLVNLLNEYLNNMSNIIMSYGGTVDRYEGDAIFAFYNAPLDLADHALLAAKAALDCDAELDRLREEWRSKDLPEVNARVGVATGNVIVGNMGARDKTTYTTHGENSHFAERLEQESKMWGTRLIISGPTWDYTHEKLFTRQLDIIPHGSMEHFVKIYELISLVEKKPDSHIEFVDRWNKAYQHYLDQQWDQSIEAFEHAKQAFGDEKGCDIYIDRCENLKQNPPTENWNGCVRTDLH